MKTYRINFVFDDQTDRTVLIRTKDTTKEIEDTLKAWKDYLYKKLDEGDNSWFSDIEYYEERLKYHTNWEVLAETVDEVINFNY